MSHIGSACPTSNLATNWADYKPISAMLFRQSATISAGTILSRSPDTLRTVSVFRFFSVFEHQTVSASCCKHPSRSIVAIDTVVQAAEQALSSPASTVSVPCKSSPVPKPFTCPASVQALQVPVALHCRDRCKLPSRSPKLKNKLNHGG
jgi:hypothetical protein